MKLEKMSAVAEIVSSVAIVVTLIYLAVQTQQTNSALAANSRAALMSADIDLVSVWAADPRLAGIAGGSLPFADIAPEEQTQHVLLMAGFVRVREFAWFQYRDGLLDERAWTGYLSTLLTTVSNNEGSRLAWEAYEPMLDRDFVAYVNEQLAAQTN